MQLRPYQREAVESIERELAQHQSTVAVLATGLGKTILFSDASRRIVERGGRVLILAHRKELIEQAASKIERVTGIRAASEQADLREGRDGASIVVGSVQSMAHRLDEFEQDHFDLVVTDECHRAVTAQHRKVSEYFCGPTQAKHLGVTATPTRGDKAALGQIYESVAYEYEIADAIPDGWLVPIDQHTVQTDIDFSEIRTTAGDFNRGELSDLMSDPQSLYQIAAPTVEMAGERPTLVFAVTVAHAHALAEAIREMTKAEVAVLDGGSHHDERRSVIEAYKAGRIQFLVNCALFTEGFDAPPTALIAMARPTKSKLLYMQCIGRGTRPLDGVVDAHATASAEVRRQAIASSEKTNVKILDFAGNSGRHSLCTIASVLEGVATPPELSVAGRLLAENQVSDVLEAYRRAKAEISEMELKRMREQARKNFRTMRVDPFTALGVHKGDDPYGRKITPRQSEVLDRAGIPTDGIQFSQASRLIGSVIERRAKDLASYNQAQLLIKRGLDPKKVMSVDFKKASKLIERLAKNSWREPAGWGDELR